MIFAISSLFALLLFAFVYTFILSHRKRQTDPFVIFPIIGFFYGVSFLVAPNSSTS